MPRFDHLTLPARDWRQTRDWYVATLQLEVEFESPDRNAVALKDEDDFTIFFEQGELGDGIALYFSVDDVVATHQQLASQGVVFAHPPQRTFWGYGAELPDPNGYAVRLWDEKTMAESGG